MRLPLTGLHLLLAPFPHSGSTATAPQQPDAAHLLQQLLPGGSKGSQLAGQQGEREQGQELPAADRPCCKWVEGI